MGSNHLLTREPSRATSRERPFTSEARRLSTKDLAAELGRFFGDHSDGVVRRVKLDAIAR